MKTKRYNPLGVITDLPPQQVGDDNYSEVVNATFRQGAAFRVAGYADGAPDPLGEPYYLIGNKRPNSQFYWVYPSLENIYTTNQTQHADITPVDQTPAEVGDWTGAELNGILMLNNGVNPPWFWDGQLGNIMESLPNFPSNTTVGWLRSYKYFAFAGDINSDGTQYDNQIYWSASVEPGLPPQEWQPLPSNDAGDNILASTQGTVIDGHQLRDTFIIAKNHSLYIASHVAGRFVFNFRKLSETVGVLTKNCMVEHHGKLFIFSDGDIVVTDGQTVASIANDRVRQRIFETMNMLKYKVCHAALYSARDEIWFCYPTGQNELCTTAAVYDLTDDNWGFRDLPNTVQARQGIVQDPNAKISWDSDDESWDSDSTRWDESGLSEIADGLMMANQEKLFAVGKSASFNGQPVNSTLEKLSMDFGNLEVQKLISEVWLYPAGRPSEALEVRIGTQDNEAQPIDWGAPQTFIIGQDKKINLTDTGRLISIRVTAETDYVWSLQGFQFFYIERGRW